MLKQLGIETGRPFAPDERLTAVLTTASKAGELMAQANTFAKRFAGIRYRPDRQWELALVLDNSASTTTSGSNACPGPARPSASPRP